MVVSPVAELTEQAAVPADIQSRMKIEIRDIGIPPRPTILAQLEAEMARDNPDFLQMGRILGTDVGISAALIKTANSPYYGLVKKVPTVQEALLVLGLRLVVQTVAGISLQQLFRHVPNMERFWDASARIARIAGWLAREYGRPFKLRAADAYTFALFRDCGIPVLLSPFPDYRHVLAAANAEVERSFTAVEDEHMAINHALVGAELAEDWLLPAEVCLAIRHHHDADLLWGHAAEVPRRSRLLIAIAQLAEYLYQQMESRNLGQEWRKLGAASLATLEMSEDMLPEILAACREEMAKA